MSPRPQDMGPFDLAPNTAPPEFHDAEEAIISERNWFFNALSFGAKERFLEAFSDARERGLDTEAAWTEAVRAAQTAYETPGDVVDDDPLPPAGP